MAYGYEHVITGEKWKMNVEKLELGLNYPAASTIFWQAEDENDQPLDMPGIPRIYLTGTYLPNFTFYILDTFRYQYIEFSSDLLYQYKYFNIV